MAISNAVDLGRISRVVGYKITKGNFQKTTPNLPQRIAVLGEANTANQSGLSTDPVEITTLTQAANLYGYGSPIYSMIRILRPSSGGGVGSVPVVVYPQAVASGATAKELEITPTGTATGNATHTLVINGRDNVEGQNYDFVVADGDNVAAITAKITDVINSVLGSPVSCVDDTTKATATAKWEGKTSQDIIVTVNTNGNPMGMTYAVTSTTSGSGTPDIQSSLDKFGSDWNTIVVNPYGVPVMDVLEAFNGIPDPDMPTGRYASIVVKPFIALAGILSGVNIEYLEVTADRKTEVTNALCPAPSSEGFPMEAAANMACIFAVQSNENPHLDVASKFYPDMPAATDWSNSDMANYANRDLLVKSGSTTVDFVNNKFQVQDFITTYRPDGENPAQFRYCRNIMLDLNVFFGYHLLEEINVIDHAIANDIDVVSANKVIKPKQWKAIIRAYADDLALRGLIADSAFMHESITVGISTTNPDRLETFFRYKRSGFARISSTTAEAGFNFG